LAIPDFGTVTFVMTFVSDCNSLNTWSTNYRYPERSRIVCHIIRPDSPRGPFVAIRGRFSAPAFSIVPSLSCSYLRGLASILRFHALSSLISHYLLFDTGIVSCRCGQRRLIMFPAYFAKGSILIVAVTNLHCPVFSISSGCIALLSSRIRPNSLVTKAIIAR